MWYDILVLAILLYFTVRGAARGMVWQLAGIAGIVVCFVFADAISAFGGPYVTLEEPLNNWVVLFGAYVVFTLISYVIAGRITELLARVKLKEFDSHLGAVLGFVKGVVICLIITFLAVTMSETARSALKQSRSGIAAARIVKTVHPYLPILPPKLVEALEKYIHLMDDENLQEHFIEEHGQQTKGQDVNGGISFGQPGQIGHDVVLPPAQVGAATLDQLGQLVSAQTKDLLISAISWESNAQTQNTLIDRLVQDLQSAPPEQRKQIEDYFLLLGQRGTESLLGELKSTLGVVDANSAILPNSDSTVVPITSPATPVVTTTRTQIAAIQKQIVAAYTTDPANRLAFEKQIEGFLGTLPDRVYLGVLQDWNADIWSLPDPDRQTTGQSTLEQRILRQLELAGVPLSTLAPAMQQRLKAASNSTSSSLRSSTFSR